MSGSRLHYIPAAGLLLCPAGGWNGSIPLVARLDHLAIDANGRLIVLPRPEEWKARMFGDWAYLPPPASMPPDKVREVCLLLETIIGHPGVDAENMQMVAMAFARGAVLALGSSPPPPPPAHLHAVAA